ncbi:allantoinase, partial [candidate division KSB1 bacterium]
MPGLIDTHVHINEPGRSEWEGFETATRAAAAGGVTTLVDMPLNSTPVTTNVDAFEQKLAAAQNKLWVDCGFYAGLVPGNH